MILFQIPDPLLITYGVLCLSVMNVLSKPWCSCKISVLVFSLPKHRTSKWCVKCLG